ncbi:hypothetical protein DFJ74DRAFT_665665 [Hyaloraphidium curvatum]|nr:hypothetical protein DFJ74DRAFT_665665 [Hyaloraphidium curvatum]
MAGSPTTVKLNNEQPLLPMSQAPVVCLIGTGVGGICGGVTLKARMGFTNFVILERTSRGFGGTWRHQSYPGLACDIPAHFYSFSFAPSAEWSSEFPAKSEIQPYIESVCEKYGLRSFVSYDTEIVDARWNNSDECWDLRIQVLESVPEGYEAGHWKSDREKDRRVLRSGVLKANLVFNTGGVFTKPYWPKYPGLESFSGVQMHASEWDDKVQLAGKRVALIGSGPTAIQIVPEIAHKVQHLDVYQRTPNWIQPFSNHPFPEELKDKWRKDPVALYEKRLQSINNAEAIWAAIEVPGSQTALRVQQRCVDYLNQTVKKKDLIPYLTPDFPMGCKRICVDTGYLAAFNRDNVGLVGDPIVRFTRGGIATDGKQYGAKEREYDVVIYATGWGAFSMGRGFPAYGRDGKEVWEQWKAIGIPRSFQGMLMVNFPNWLMCIGPFGNVYTSHYEQAEQVSDFMVKMLNRMIRDDLATFEVREEAEAKWAAMCKKNLATTPYRGNCISYYKFSWDHAEDSGKQAESSDDYENPAWFPGTAVELRVARENISDDDLVLRPNRPGRTWKAHAAALRPQPGFGEIAPGVSTFRLKATRGRKGPPPEDLRDLERRVWSRL